MRKCPIIYHGKSSIAAKEGVVFREMRFFGEVDLYGKSGFNNISYGWDIGNSVLHFPIFVLQSNDRSCQKALTITPTAMPENENFESFKLSNRKLDAFCIVYIAIADSI